MTNLTFHTTAESSIGKHVLFGSCAVGVLILGLGGWAATTELAGAVIASGTVVVDSNVKKVQHPTGGVVAQLLVREGERVHAGQVLAKLDETVTRANLSIVVKTLDELRARKTRLEAERDGLSQIEPGPNVAKQPQSVAALEALASENKLFTLRKDAREGQKSQLRQRAIQLSEEIGGQQALRDSKSEELILISQELTGVRTLWEKNLIPLTRLTSLEREATRLKGERAQSVSSTAQAKGKIAEIELQILQIDQDLSSEVAKELRDVDSKIGESSERMVAAADQLSKIDIRAPQDGIVLQLGVHTIGGVISPGEQIMLIVPDGDQLSVEAKVSPQEIDQLYLAQKASLKFSAFNQRTTPEIDGAISRISADVATDQKTGQSYYTVRVAIASGEVNRLGDAKLLPGMPVEVFMRTHDRTVMSYFVKPLLDQIARALRER